MKTSEYILLVFLFFKTVSSQDYAEYARGYGNQRKNNKGSLVAGVLGGIVISKLISWINLYIFFLN